MKHASAVTAKQAACQSVSESVTHSVPPVAAPLHPPASLLPFFPILLTQLLLLLQLQRHSLPAGHDDEDEEDVLTAAAQM